MDDMNIQSKKLLLTTNFRMGALFSYSVLFCGTAHAGHFVEVPEPGMLPLMAMGGAVGLVVYIRNRRKK
jgi:PEP-CTERM motif-containing protein